MKKWWKKQWVQVAVFALGLALVRFYPFLLGQTLYFGDNYTLLAPGKIWSAQWLLQGVYPLWNPYLFSGISWVGDISQSLLSLSIIPYLLLSPTVALNVNVVGHFLFTFVGMYLLTRSISKNHWWSIVAAGLWSVSSLWTGAAHNLATLQSLSWFPWVIWAGYRLDWSLTAIIRLGIITAGLVSAGYPQHILAAVPAATLLSFSENWRSWRTLIPAWTISMIIALGLAAAIWAPFVPALLDSTRQLMGPEQSARGSFHPAEIIKLVVPYFYDAPILGIRWGPNWNFFPTNMPYFTWFGLVVLLGTLFKRSLSPVQHGLRIGLIIGFILSMGEYIPGYISLLEIIPALSAIRYPSTWLFLPEIFGLVLLATFAPKWKPPSWLKSKLSIFLLLVMLLSTTSLLIWWQYPQQTWNLIDSLVKGKLTQSAFHNWERNQLIALLISTNLLINSFLLLIAWKLWHLKKWALMVAVLLLEGLINSQAIVLFAPASIYVSATHFEQLELVESLRDPHHRVITRNGNHPYTDFGSYWEAVAVRPPFSDSFVDSKEMRTNSHLIGLRDGLVFDWNIVANVPIVNGYTTLLPADYQNIWQESGETRVNLMDYISIDDPLLSQWSVKYYVVDHWFLVEEDLSEYPEIYRDSRWSVYELPALNRFRFVDDSPAPITALEENPNRISFNVNATHSAMIMADRYERGWIARVNSQEVELANTNGMRQIPLVEGDNEVILTYAPFEFRLGVIISLTTLAGITIGYLYNGIKKDRHLAACGDVW